VKVSADIKKIFNQREENKISLRLRFHMKSMELLSNTGIWYERIRFTGEIRISRYLSLAT